MRFSCSWLVAMSEKDARSVRVGCGRYDWLFTSTVPRLVEQLTITVEAMQITRPHSPWFSYELAVWTAASVV